MLSEKFPREHQFKPTLFLSGNIDEAASTSQVALHIPIVECAEFSLVKGHGGYCSCPKKTAWCAPIGIREVGQHRRGLSRILNWVGRKVMKKCFLLSWIDDLVKILIWRWYISELSKAKDLREH